MKEKLTIAAIVTASILSLFGIIQLIPIVWKPQLIREQRVTNVIVSYTLAGMRTDKEHLKKINKSLDNYSLSRQINKLSVDIAIMERWLKARIEPEAIK